MNNTTRSKGGIIATIFVYGLELALLAVTGWHTFSLIAITLPGDNQIIGYAALGAFDLGLLIWSSVLMYGAKGRRQRAVALTMVTVSLLGITAAFFSDMFLQTARRGLTSKLDEFTITIIVIVLGVVIIANIVAAVVFHASDPEHLKTQAEEEAKEEIHSAALALIKQQAPTLAAQLAPHVAQDWMKQMIEAQMAGLNITAQMPRAQAPNYQLPGAGQQQQHYQPQQPLPVPPPPAPYVEEIKPQPLPAQPSPRRLFNTPTPPRPMPTSAADSGGNDNGDNGGSFPNG